MYLIGLAGFVDRGCVGNSARCERFRSQDGIGKPSSRDNVRIAMSDRTGRTVFMCRWMFHGQYVQADDDCLPR